MDPYATAPWRRPTTGNSSPTPYPGSASPSLSSSSPFSASPTRFTPTSPPPFNGTPGGFMSPRITSPLVPSPLTFTPKLPSPGPPSPTPHYSPVSSPAGQSPRNSITSPSVDGIPNFAPPSPLSTPPTEGGPAGLPTPPPPPPPPPPLPNAGDTVPWRIKPTVMEDIDYNTPIVNHSQPQTQNQNHHINQPTRRTSAGQYDNLPAALQSTLMKDKKPFTYTPGGIDLSEIRSPRMAKRLHYNQRDPPGNLARINIPPPPPPQDQDSASKVTSPPPPETYPQPRVQILPQPQAKMQVFPTSTPQFPPPPPPAQNAVPKLYPANSQRAPPAQMQQQQQQQQPKQQHQQSVEQPKSQERTQAFVNAQYNSPMNLYSAENAAQAYQDQTGDVVPEYENLSVNSPPPGPREEDGFVPYYKEQRPQSRSFRLLQVMTDTTAGEGENAAAEEAQRPAAKQPEDEMRFTGVRRNPIPSRAFQTLQRMTGDDVPQPYSPVQNHQTASEANAGECELRYRGACIPSRSFRLLQEMTGGSDDDGAPSPSSTLPRPAKKMTTVNMQVMGNGPSSVQALDLNANQGNFVPPSQQKAEADPKKYTGGHIPSRSFRMLQAMTGGADDDDVNDSSAPVNNVAMTNESHAPEAEPRMYMGGNIPSRSFRLLQAMTEPDGPQGGGMYATPGLGNYALTSYRFEQEFRIFEK